MQYDGKKQNRHYDKQIHNGILLKYHAFGQDFVGKTPASRNECGGLNQNTKMLLHYQHRPAVIFFRIRIQGLFAVHYIQELICARGYTQRHFPMVASFL